MRSLAAVILVILLVGCTRAPPPVTSTPIEEAPPLSTVGLAAPVDSLSGPILRFADPVGDTVRANVVLRVPDNTSVRAMVAGKITSVSGVGEDQTLQIVGDAPTYLIEIRHVASALPEGQSVKADSVVARAVSERDISILVRDHAAGRDRCIGALLSTAALAHMGAGASSAYCAQDSLPEGFGATG